MRCMFFPISGRPDNSLFCTLAFIYHYLIVSYFSWSSELGECWSRTLREKSRWLNPMHGKLKLHGNRLRRAYNDKKSQNLYKVSFTPCDSDKIERLFKAIESVFKPGTLRTRALYERYLWSWFWFLNNTS